MTVMNRALPMVREQTAYPKQSALLCYQQPLGENHVVITGYHHAVEAEAGIEDSAQDSHSASYTH